MRIVLGVGLLCAVTSMAADRTSVVVLTPAIDGKVPTGLNLAMQEKASAFLMATGKYDVVHVRQLQSMARRHRIDLGQLFDPNVARSAAERLGVQVFVYSKLTAIKTGYTFEVSVSRHGEPKTTSSTSTLPPGDAAAVNAGGKELATEALKFDGVTDPIAGDAQPSTKKDVAMKNYGACLQKTLEQPVGIENPTVVNDGELKKAIASCETAVKLDSDFSAAWATLAFASAVAGNDVRAVEALTSVKPTAGHVPASMTARFWLVSRYQTAEAAEHVLTDAILKEPGFLLARVYLAELYNALGKQAEAAKAWQAYAAHSEGNAFVISRLAYTLARLGKTAEASKYAEQAIAYDPAAYDVALEYGSRLIDDGQYDKAIAILEPLSARPDVPGELLLRLGYAKFKKGDIEGAETLTKKADDIAKAPGEWRTRARANVTLALIALQRGKKDAAKSLTTDALKEGVRPTSLPPELTALLTDKELKAAEAKGLGKVKGKKESSPLPIAAGEVTPDGPRARAPKGFDQVKVP